jgi:2-dehydropantoate 2-reductase
MDCGSATSMGRDRRMAPESLNVTADPAAALSGADIVLVTVKSGATQEMAALIAAHARPAAVVLSLQNGVDNADRLRAGLGPRLVVAGMVPFNVVQSPSGELPLGVHRASAGKVMIEDGVPDLVGLLDVDGFAASARGDMTAVLWGKLLLNLNNALVALCGLPLAAQLADRPLAVDPGRSDRQGVGCNAGLRHRAGTDRRPASGAVAESAAPARLAVQGPGAAYARDRSQSALIDVG